jgi:hypothetical protein
MCIDLFYSVMEKTISDNMDLIVKKEMEEENTTFEEHFCLHLKSDEEEDQLVRYKIFPL